MQANLFSVRWFLIAATWVTSWLVLSGQAFSGEDAGAGPASQVVAPLFIHGSGRGAADCLGPPPVFLMPENEGREIVIAEFAREGIVFDKRDVDLEKEGFLGPGAGAAGRLVVDGYSTAANLAFEFVSAKDLNIQDLGRCSCKEYSSRAVAKKTRETFAKSGKFNAVVFYDPMASHAKKALPCKDREAEQQEMKARATRLLNAQVRSAVSWLKRNSVAIWANPRGIGSSVSRLVAEPQNPIEAAEFLGALDLDGDDMFKVVGALDTAAVQCLDVGKREKARELGLRAHSTIKNMGPTHALGAKAQLVLSVAGWMLDAGLLREVREISELALGETNALPSLVRSDGVSWFAFPPRTQVYEYLNLVQVYARLGDFDLALALAEKAFAMASRLPGGHHGESPVAWATLGESEATLCEALVNAGRANDARKCLKHAQELLMKGRSASVYPPGLISVATAYGLLGEKAVAQKHFAAAEKVMLAFPEFLLEGAIRLAKAFDRLGDKKQAARVFEKAHRAKGSEGGDLADDSAKLMVEAARWHLQNGVKEKGIQFAKAAYDLAVKNPADAGLPTLVRTVMTLSRVGEKDLVAKGLSAALDRLRGQVGKPGADPGYQLFIIGGVYDATDTPFDDAAQKVLREILAKVDAAGGKAVE